MNEIEAMLRVMIAAYPYARIKPQTIRVYCEMLSDIEPSLLRRAALMCLAQIKFFPTIAELREAAVSLMGPAYAVRSGIEAWGDVLAEVKRVGYNGEPRFDDPAITAIVDGFGWRNICLDEDVMVLRAHFVRAYEQVARREHDLARQTPEIQARLRGTVFDRVGGPQAMHQILRPEGGST